MADYWLTVLLDHQRTFDIRVSGESFSEVVEKYKTKDGHQVIAVRPCSKEAPQKPAGDFAVCFDKFLRELDEMSLDRPTLIQLKDKHQALKIVDQLRTSSIGIEGFSGAFQKACLDIEADVLHGFYVLGVQFCWPGDQALADFDLLKGHAS